MHKLLAIDDEPGILKSLERTFRDHYQVLTAKSATEGLRLVQENHPDVIILDLFLPDLPGLQVFGRIREIDSRIPVIFLTGAGSTDSAIEAMKLGAFDYQLKPWDDDELQGLVARAVEISRLSRVPATLPDEPPSPGPSDVFVGRCPGMLDVYKQVGRVASRDLTVLILGESGSGKEMVARAIYQHSARATGAFLAINCAAITETLLESELFGHEKGAFTGADRKKIGKFEQCSGGTLFLDEIGEMTPLTQTKLLRVLQEQRFERVGGNETIQTNVRIIAATNRDLEAAVNAGTFRRDLYYRLNVFTIQLPPLRDRGDDIVRLSEHFVRQFGRELQKDVQRIAPDAIELLRAHAWPGNVRELQSVIKQALIKATGPVLVPDFLPESIRSPLKPAGGGGEEAGPAPDWNRFVTDQLAGGSKDLYGKSLELMEHYLITRVLKHTDGKQLQAAAILGITRGSLRNKIRTLGITIKSRVGTEDDEEEPATGGEPKAEG
jgi:two-component system nitrogen regulation response regulator GlnG